MQTDTNIIYQTFVGPAKDRVPRDKHVCHIRGNKMKKIALATAFAMAATSAFAGNPVPATTEAPVVPAPEAAASSASSWVIPVLLLLAIAAAADKN